MKKIFISEHIRGNERTYFLGNVCIGKMHNNTMGKYANPDGGICAYDDNIIENFKTWISDSLGIDLSECQIIFDTLIIC